MALFERGRLVATTQHHHPEEHAERLHALMEDLFSHAPFSQREVDVVLVGKGPGSFTGIRVGIAFAKGLAKGLEKPVFGVSSLKAMAASHLDGQPTTMLCPMLDAGRGDVFVAAYNGRGEQHLAPCVLQGKEVMLTLRSLPGHKRLLGDAAQRLGLSGFEEIPALPLADSFWLALWPDPRLAPDWAALGPEHDPLPAYLKEPNITPPLLAPPPSAALGLKDSIA